MNNLTFEEKYNLPYFYNEDCIILLVKNPYCLFTYWEITSKLIQNFINSFGQNAWDNSKLSIKINNLTNGDIKYVEVYNTCGSWYIENIHPNCIYSAEIGKLFDNNMFVNLLSSNTASSPRDKESSNKSIYFSRYTELKKSNVLMSGKHVQDVLDNVHKKFGISSSELIKP